MLTQRMRDFMAHHHRYLVVGEFELVQDAGVKSNLATRHTKRVDLVGANQVNFPCPVFGAGVPLQCEGYEFFGYATQTLNLWMVIGPQGVFASRLFQHLRILLAGRLLNLCRRHQVGKRRLFAHFDTFARKNRH